MNRCDLCGCECLTRYWTTFCDEFEDNVQIRHALKVCKDCVPTDEAEEVSDEEPSVGNVHQ